MASSASTGSAPSFMVGWLVDGCERWSGSESELERYRGDCNLHKDVTRNMSMRRTTATSDASASLGCSLKMIEIRSVMQSAKA
jgi:hypothetical protein